MVGRSRPTYKELFVYELNDSAAPDPSRIERQQFSHGQGAEVDNEWYSNGGTLDAVGAGVQGVTEARTDRLVVDPGAKRSKLAK